MYPMEMAWEQKIKSINPLPHNGAYNINDMDSEEDILHEEPKCDFTRFLKDHFGQKFSKESRIIWLKDIGNIHEIDKLSMYHSLLMD